MAKDPLLTPARIARLKQLQNAGPAGLQVSGVGDVAGFAGIATLGWAERGPANSAHFTLTQAGADALERARTAKSKEEPVEA